MESSFLPSLYKAEARPILPLFIVVVKKHFTLDGLSIEKSLFPHYF